MNNMDEQNEMDDTKSAVEILRDVFVEVRDEYRNEWRHDATVQAKDDIRQTLLALVKMRQNLR